MRYDIQEVLEFVEENDVKFIRLAFCDLLGNQKNMAIISNRLEEAFTSGISFDAGTILGFNDVAQSDLLLVPDPSTMMVLPWRPQQGKVVRFLCDIKNPDMTPYSGDTRSLLSSVVARCDSMGLQCNVGTECEFYLFKTDEQGEPTHIPQDEGGYLDISPLDKGENVRREACLCLEEMGIQPLSSHHELGYGQNEIDFRYSEPLDAADNYMTFKTMVKAIGARNGLYVSFMPKPISDQSGNGVHVNVSLSKNGKNLFGTNNDKAMKIEASFIAGVLKRAVEMSLFTNPIENSYERLGTNEAPKYVSWSRQNRSQLVRIPAASGEMSRMELRSPDTAINPYLVIALILNAGLDGVEHNEELPLPVDLNLYKADKGELSKLQKLPDSLGEALEIAKNSEFLRKTLGNDIFDKYIALKEEEVAASKDISPKDINIYSRKKYFKVL